VESIGNGVERRRFPDRPDGLLVQQVITGGLKEFDEKEEAIIMASESVSYDATLVYAEGLELYDDGDKDLNVFFGFDKTWESNLSATSSCMVFNKSYDEACFENSKLIFILYL